MFGRKRHFVVALLSMFLVSSLASASVGFHSTVSYAVGTAPVAIVTGDFNGDGKPDLYSMSPLCLLRFSNGV